MPMHSKSFTGSRATSIDLSRRPMDAWTHALFEERSMGDQKWAGIVRAGTAL
jgi:hypothetical protein